MALTQEQARELEQVVEQRRAALRAEVERDLDRLREDGADNVVGAVPDSGDELSALEAAHERIAGGSYGQCIQCGQDIGIERLRASPAAERCIRCQTLFEKLHGGAGTPTL